MTQHVQQSYRKHRKAAWGLALVLALTVAGIVLPLASGAAGKTYTFTGNIGVCSGTSSTSFDVVLKNTSNSQNLGSADLYAPSDITVTNATMTGSTTGTTAVTTYPNGVTPDTNDPTTTGRSLISLRSLTVPGGSSVTVHVTASLSTPPGSGTYWYSIVKQANSFNPGSLDLSNTFAIQGSNPTVTVAPCQYFFSKQPVDTQTGTAQTVQVQLRSGTTAVAVSGSLSLDAYQDGTQVDSKFTGLTSTGGQDAFNTWSFSVTGNVSNASGHPYTLVAGSGTAQGTSNSFNIADCIPDGSGNCSSPVITAGDGTTAAQFSGSGIVGTGVNLSYTDLSDAGFGICEAQGWTPMTFGNPPQSFDPARVDTFTYKQGSTGGYLKMTLYFRNDLYVQTTASQTNSIQLCAGAKHTVLQNDGTNPWIGANGIPAQFDSISQEYWGVLQRIPNCNSNKIPFNNGIYSPALCGWGTVTLSDGLSYRSATVIVPYDWDWKVGG
jgi:hypothetical protein